MVEQKKSYCKKVTVQMCTIDHWEDQQMSDCVHRVTSDSEDWNDCDYAKRGLYTDGSEGCFCTKDMTKEIDNG